MSAFGPAGAPGMPAFGGPSPMRQQAAGALAKAMVVLYWVAAAATAGLAASMVHRGGVVGDLFKNLATIDDVNSSDNQVAGVLLLVLVVMLAAAMVTSLWSRRVVHNAQVGGATGLNPGMAGGGWFIPIGWFFIPFQQLRATAKGLGRAAKSLPVWQAAFVVGFVLAIVSRVMVRDNALTAENVGNKFTNQGYVMFAAAAAFAVAAVFAGRTTKELDGRR